MECTCLLSFLILCTISQSTGNSVFSWIWGKESTEEEVMIDGLPLVSIPYESMTDDEKFLKSAAEFTDIQISSPLEICQHKVILKIKTSCTAMTEEELGKLSVNLLNCQSAVEGRKMFPCTEQMTLKQCTTNMDADMWNVYHLMSNRARAVCYASRSTQFRALAELTVNKLMQTTHTQINALNLLKEGQERLEEQTSAALSSLTDGHKALLLQQQHLKDAQVSSHKLVTTNLRQLTNEKALIKAGHAQLATMVEEIRKKIEEIIELDGNHREIIEEALEKLKQINESVQYIWNITNTMRGEIDRKLSWITDYIDDTGEQIQKAYYTGLHVVYLLVAMIIAAFLQAPFLTRITIMGLVPLNLASYLKHSVEASLDFTSMTALILLITAMHFVMVGIQYVFGPNDKSRKCLQSEKAGYLNGTSKGVAYTSSPDMRVAAPKRPHLFLMSAYYIKLKKNTLTFFNTIHYELNCFAQKCTSVVQSIISWIRPSLTQSEELSCSYISSKRTREDLIHDYEQEFPSMSEDITDFETSLINSINRNNIDDHDNWIDASELRRRSREVNNRFDSRSSYSCDVSSSSLNGSPSRGQYKRLCKGITQQGKHCRRYTVNPESDYCFLHN